MGAGVSRMDTVIRTLTVSLEGATLSANELLDLVRRSVSKIRESDADIADYSLYDVRFKFQNKGVLVTAEFRR
ncbi:MAG: hypothetical protein JWN30_340 [Bacilli bacterium]|nr:hypothetical protein [Bacilli bacterium]